MKQNKLTFCQITECINYGDKRAELELISVEGPRIRFENCKTLVKKVDLVFTKYIIIAYTSRRLTCFVIRRLLKIVHSEVTGLSLPPVRTLSGKRP